jgi:hypothetical protein
MSNYKIAWSSTELVDQYNYFSSGHFFDKDTMRFFKSRVTSNYRRLNDNEAFFITTEKHDGAPRYATLRKAILVSYIREKDGRECHKIKIETIGQFNKMSLPKAIREMNKL